MMISTGFRFHTALPGFLFACLLVLLPGPARTHPHVWIDAVVKPQFKDGKLTAFSLDWTFDEFYSFLVIDDFDSNKNGVLDDPELDALAKASRDTLGTTDYFLRVMVDGEKTGKIDFRDLAANVFMERVSYSFTAVLDTPLDIRVHKVTFATYDEDYYIEITLNPDDPVRFEGDWPQACRYEIGTDEVNKIYYDLVAPTVVRFPCPAS
jgi:tRNA threonylcarbamoyladenosine biosynthesis protein TsaE